MPTQPIPKIPKFGIPEAVEVHCCRVSHDGPTILLFLGHAGALGVLILALVNLLLAAPTAWAFNSDAKTDIVWRDSVNGTNTAWMMGGANGATYLSPGAINPVTDPNWKIVGTGDFNRDGQLDLVWRKPRPGTTCFGI